MAITVTIDGEAVCVYGPQGQLQLSVQDSVNGRATAQLRIQDLSSTYAAKQPGGFQFKEITAVDGTDTVFAGIITNQRNSTEPGLQDYHYIDLRATDWTILLDRRRVFGLFEKGEFVTTIIQSLLDQKAPGGTDSASSDGVTRANVDGALQIESRLIIEGATIAQALDEISKMVGAHWYVDWAKDIHMSKTGAAAPFAINDALGSCKFASIWSEQTTERYRNTQRIRRDFSSVPESIRVFAANGADRTFYVALPLAEAPTVIRRSQTYAETSVSFSPTGNVSAGDMITIDGVTYTFRTTLAAANDVLIGATSAESTRNLSYAINNQAVWEGELYHADTAIHPTCEAAYETGHLIWVRFREISLGNGTAISQSSSAITLGASTLTGAGPGDNETASVGEYGTTVSGSDWYWKAGSTAINQDDAAATPLNGEYIEVRYKPLFANWASAYDLTEVAARGRWESAEDENANSDGTISKSVAEAFLRRYGVIPTSFQYVMYAEKEPLVNQLVSGMAQSVTAPCVGIATSTALIAGISRNWRFTFWEGVGTWRTSNTVTGVIYPGSATDEPWSSWLEFFAPKGTGTITGGGGTGGSGTSTTPAANFPGPIRDFLLQSGETVDTSSEPGFALVPLQYREPTAVNGFATIRLWLTADGLTDAIAVGEIPHELGVTGLQTFTVRFPLSGVAWENAILWGASGSATHQNPLITSGAGETPSLGLGNLPAYTVGAPAAPEIPLGAAVAVLDRGENYALQITITPPSPLGGTAGYEREVKFYNDAGLTVEDHPDWIELGFVDTTSTVSISGPWPRPGYNQWVKCRVRGINWDGVTTAWVESSSAAVLTPLALPPAIQSNDSTVELIDDGDISEFFFHLALTPAASIGTTTWYEAFVRYFNNAGLTIPDDDWIYLGGIDPATGGHDTSRWRRREIDQWAVIRIYGKNAANKLGPSVNSATLVIPKRPAAATSGASMYATSATAVRVSPVTYSADGIEQTEIDVDWIQPTNTDARTILVTVTNPADAGDTDRETHREKIGDWANHGAARSLRIGPWPTKTETTRVKIWTINRDDIQLGSPVTIDVSITAQAFLQATSFTGGTEDYDAKRGAVVKPITLTAPADPRLTGFVIFQERGSGPDEEVGFVACTSGATVTHSVTVELPITGTQSVTLYATPRRIGATAPLTVATASLTFTVDSNEQAPASSYEGFDRYVLASNPTLSKTPAAGKQYIVILEQNATGGFAPTWNASHFRNAAKIPAPWPDANSTTVYNFQGDDFGAGVLWQFTGAVFDV